MNALQFSTKQFFTIISATVFATAAVFALGLLSASLIAEPRHTEVLPGDETPIAAIEPMGQPLVQAPIPEVTAIAEQEVPFEELPVPAAGPKPGFGIQIAVFNDLGNALQFSARQPSNAAYQPRIFSRADSKTTTVYPVLVGLYDNMAAAQQAKLAYQKQFSIDAFVSDASQLQEEIMVTPALAMAR